MKTEQLILQLQEDTKPKASFMPFKNWLLWSFVSIAVMILRFFLWKTQSPNLMKNFDLYFFQESILLSLLFVFVPYLTFKLSVPGFKNSKLALFTAALFAGWIFLLVHRATIPDIQEIQSVDFFQGTACTYEILLMALIPLYVIFNILKKGASMHPLRSGMMAAVSATMIGTLILQVLCQSPSSIHILVFHFGAVLLASTMGAFLGTFFLRW